MNTVPESPEDMHPERPGAWMQTNSGGQFFPLDPKPEEIVANDFSNGLALTCRYGGQGNINRFYSVAEHSYHMAMYAMANGAEPEVAFATLLHDAAEGYTGDLIRAMKVAVGYSYKKVEHAVEAAVAEKYRLAFVFHTHAAYIKDLDQRIVPLEKEYLFGAKGLDWAFDQFEPLEGVTIQGWQPAQAKLQFLTLHNRFCHLTGRDHLIDHGDFR